jgi:hypothetical protein
LEELIEIAGQRVFVAISGRSIHVHVLVEQVIERMIVLLSEHFVGFPFAASK